MPGYTVKTLGIRNVGWLSGLTCTASVVKPPLSLGKKCAGKQTVTALPFLVVSYGNTLADRLMYPKFCGGFFLVNEEIIKEDLSSAT